ncbi:alk-exo [Clostera anastomosis granulovirus A]|uniref:Alk-exo n=1 Tax=Clostera anastomosis granulovirus A TaxID=1986289 RepID=U5KBN4_9BBAC|nr:alk-exo [Clostera anastomosis granulovirus Henan]AGQ20368.1 alk-exo [Clostera anastomosis granulovirus Henan]
MAFEMVKFEGVLTDEQLELGGKYSLEKYVRTLTLQHRNSVEDIMLLESATRGQSKNPLWKLLRINRTTASGGGNFCGKNSPAIQYGIRQEKLLKRDTIVMNVLKEAVEKKLKKRVVQEVLDCGLFISSIGLHSASPDAYLVLETKEIVVVEIKCPYTYRNENLETIRTRMNTRQKRYRVPHTAFSINRHGPLQVTVEKANDHYRQMQAQMYVTGACMAVYVVKLRDDMPEIHFVDRDEALIGSMHKNELYQLKVHVHENRRNRAMVMESERVKTFVGSGYEERVSRLLARDGFYYWCGSVSCYFCGRRFEMADCCVEDVIYKHMEEACNKTENVILTQAHSKSFLNVFDRIDNLRSVGVYSPAQCEDMARRGLYHDGIRLVLYCCGGTNGNHENLCQKELI